MTDATLVILGASAGIAGTARGLGCQLVFVQPPGAAVSKLVEKNKLSHVFPVDYTDPDEFGSFVDQVLRPMQVGAVISVTENGLLPAAMAGERLGLLGTPVDVVRCLRDKALMRGALDGTALSVRYATPANGDEAAAIAREWGVHEVIVKPRDSSGSINVTRAAVEDLSRRDSLDGYLIEEFLPGQEYSAETFSVGGEIVLFALTEKHTSENFVELAHVMPAIGVDADAVEASIADFLARVGLIDGPAHTEFKLVDGSVKIIESHNRIGGDGIPQLVQRVTGTDLKSWSLGWPLGLGGPSDADRPLAKAAAIAFATAAPGTVQNVKLPTAEDVRVDYLWAAVKPGDLVGELASSADRVGGVSVLADDPAAALASARALADQVIVTTDGTRP